LLLPGIQKNFTVFKEVPLKGAFRLTKADSLTNKNWFSGQFQQTYTNAFNDAVGLKPTMIRVINQINFSLFNQSSISYIIVGKSGYLYEEHYITAYLGKDKLKQKELRKKIGYIHQIQDYLEQKGINFLLVFSPNKARIYPEYIPSRYLSQRKGTTNYDEYLQIIHQEYPDLHFFDVNAYFRQLKKTIDFPLYSKGGTHWANYVLYNYFLDSLIHYMGSVQRQKFPPLLQRNFHWSKNLVSPDDDIQQTINLFFSKGNEKLPYADFFIEKGLNNKNPGVLVVSDSYFSMLYGSSLLDSLFKKVDFWYYNKKRYPEEYYKGNNDPGFLRTDLLQHDFVILMATEVNIKDMFLFPEGILSWLNIADAEIKGRDSVRKERINYYINAIYTHPNWLNNIKEQAKSKNVSLEELIRDNAEYMEQNERLGKSK
jgi:hypothetical protein